MTKKLVFCNTAVKNSNIRRENRDGIEHIVITSFTLPPDIVMNGGLYPSEEIDKSFHTLERTIAPVEHPQVNGQWVSATDPLAINNFYAGAWNENVEKIDDGRIKIEKVVNVQEAMKTDRGKRLIDRIEGLENNTDNRPIHTSVGVFVEAEELEEPKVNAAGDSFGWIARNMFFDHDAILLDSIGAATPGKGVGIGINSTGDKHHVEFATCDADVSHDEIRETLRDRLNKGLEPQDHKFIIDVFDNWFVYETQSGEQFRAEYSVDENSNISIQDTRHPVRRVVEYRTTNQPEQEGETMRDDIIAKLKELGIAVNADLNDSELLAKYNEALIANTGDDKDLVETVKKQADQIEALRSELAANSAKELDAKIKQIKTCSKFDMLSESALKAIHANSVEDFDQMYQDSIPSVGIGSTTDAGKEDDGFAVNADLDNLPE